MDLASNYLLGYTAYSLLFPIFATWIYFLSKDNTYCHGGHSHFSLSFYIQNCCIFPMLEEMSLRYIQYNLPEGLLSQAGIALLFSLAHILNYSTLKLKYTPRDLNISFKHFCLAFTSLFFPLWAGFLLHYFHNSVVEMLHDLLRPKINRSRLLSARECTSKSLKQFANDLDSGISKTVVCRYRRKSAESRIDDKYCRSTNLFGTPTYYYMY